MASHNNKILDIVFFGKGIPIMNLRRLSVSLKFYIEETFTRKMVLF